MKNEKIQAGIDIGGTKVNLGIVASDGSILAKTMIPSGDAGHPERLAERIQEAFSALLNGQGLRTEDLTHVGVGIPGTADTLKGTVRYSCNLFGEKEVPLGAILREKLGTPVTVVQDSWAAAWAEHLFGAARGLESALCLTVGTGIGCGVLMSGKILAGAMQAAGELGHTPIEWNGRPCSCGRRGCLEAYASGTAILVQALERFPGKFGDRPRRAETVFDLDVQGDPDAAALLDEVVDRLAYGISMAATLFSVDHILISGGICDHESRVIAPLAEKARKYGYPAWAASHGLTVRKAALGADAPMVGAAFLTAGDMLF